MASSKMDAKFAVSLASQDALVKRMGGPPAAWAGRCHEAAFALVAELEEMGVEGAALRRGYFIGRTKPGALFHERPVQHSWVELADGQVCDPTRFAFTLDEMWPLWIGPADEYDVGGMRSQGSSGPPPDCDDAEIELKVSSVDYFAGLLGLPEEFYGEGDDGEDGWLLIGHAQAHWLAHLPVVDGEGPGVLSRFFAPELFEAMEAAKLKVLIPIDRWDYVMGGRRP